MKKTLLLGFFILLVLAIWIYQNQAAKEIGEIKSFEKQKGVC